MAGEQAKHEVSFDAAQDVLTFDGFKFSGELLRTLTATPCGIMFRIVARGDGGVTVSEERDPLAMAAPDMLALLNRMEWALRERPALSPSDAELLEDIVGTRFKATGRLS